MKKRTVKRQKVPLPAWLIDVFDEYGADTSRYIIDRSEPYIEESSALQYLGIPPPDTEIPTMAAEPVEISPCIPTDTESDCGTETAPPRRFTTIGLYPSPKAKYKRGFPLLEKDFLCSSGTDPPWHSKVRIRSPSYRITISDISLN